MNHTERINGLRPKSCASPANLTPNDAKRRASRQDIRWHLPALLQRSGFERRSGRATNLEADPIDSNGLKPEDDSHFLEYKRESGSLSTSILQSILDVPCNDRTCWLRFPPTAVLLLDPLADALRASFRTAIPVYYVLPARDKNKNHCGRPSTPDHDCVRIRWR